MKKKTKRKYWIAAIVWLATMILANSINEYFHASPLIRGITVGFWTIAAYILFKDLMHPQIGRRKKEDEEEDECTKEKRRTIGEKYFGTRKNKKPT